jgi:uncharacterized FlaG/YvyC family protein
MKINSITAGSMGYPSRVREFQTELEKASSQDRERQQNHDQTPKQNDENPQSSKSENLEQAVEAFSAEQQVQANGLSASVTGIGPGLKVVLRDEQGSIVRQLTGDEFLKLREAAFGNGPTPGKILDQKL